MVRITSSQPKDQPDKDQPAARITRQETPRDKRAWKRAALTLVALLFFGAGWFSYQVAAAASKVFTENTTGGSPVLHGKKLPGVSQDRVNILLIGVGGPGHDGPNLADTIQVASVDPKSKHVAMLSIPRDLYVQVPNSGGKVKINEVHSTGEDNGAKGGGPGLLKQSVADIINQPIHYFLRVDFDGFRDLVNAVGGIDLTVKEQLYDPYYPRGESAGYEILNIRPGQQHMDGDTALKYARSRETTTDFDRSRRQQEVMSGVRDKALSLGFLSNPAKLAKLAEIAGDHVKTDLSPSETEKLAEIIQDIPATNITSKVLDNGPDGLLYDSVGPGGAYILVPRSGSYADIQAFVDQFFNSTAIAGEAATIDLQNASGRDGLAVQEKEALAGFGYNIATTSNAPGLAQATVIYDYARGQKSSTVAALEKRFKVKVTKLDRPPNDPIDIRVIIGTDYSSSGQLRYQGVGY